MTHSDIMILVVLYLWTGQNKSSLFKIDNSLIATFYFFLSKVGIDTVSIWYRCSISAILIQYQCDIAPITTCQITVINSITKKMYEKKVHFYRYQIVINILLTMYGKKVHFYHYQIDIELLSILLLIRY
jgi:hypothetical protein